MIVILLALAGAIWGGIRAARRKGNKLDIAQYATVHAIAFALLGLFLTIFIEKWLI
ncbi:apolipoprotein acyltransferase [Sagittula salina]|uniref:Apolipoprotein acyltransferase n=1 Tax=Sagittula salina TaxID=2820268 RepID=A0A940MQB1_9RHOB|nr:apolipoprotein acyltransferase [Sagittula salina]MBP0483007.1 apolipoprotein acyltransferase [Sagittula salina]